VRARPGARHQLQQAAATFFRTTGSLLRRADGLTRLGAWVAIGRDLYGQQGWQGEFLSQAFAAAPQAVVILDPAAYRLWAAPAPRSIRR
jgi:hypothetical protein